MANVGQMECRITFSDAVSAPQVRLSTKLGRKADFRLIHCFKVGLSLCLVSLFYYMRPLYDGLGGNAMWAILTAVIAFEYTVGATICKCVNRGGATILAGALGVGVHWVASQFGPKIGTIIVQFSVFLLAAAASFSRFLPLVKAQFDHGVLIFILTFILVSVSGYRVRDLLEMANHRLSTVGIGASICVIVNMFICPIWAGNELHNLVKTNMADMADSLDGCVAEYFMSDGAKANDSFKSVVNSKAAEEALINFALWEPAHGRFNFGHPWKEYLQLGDLLRSCACSIDALHGLIITHKKTPCFLKKHFSKVCVKLSSNSSAVLKELATVMTTMGKTPKMDLRVEEMMNAVEEVQKAMTALGEQPIRSNSGGTSEGKEESDTIPLVDIIPLVTLSSLLVEIAARTWRIVNAVNELAAKSSSDSV